MTLPWEDTSLPWRAPLPGRQGSPLKHQVWEEELSQFQSWIVPLAGILAQGVTCVFVWCATENCVLITCRIIPFYEVISHSLEFQYLLYECNIYIFFFPQICFILIPWELVRNRPELLIRIRQDPQVMIHTKVGHVLLCVTFRHVERTHGSRWQNPI